MDFYNIRVAREKDGTHNIFVEWVVNRRVTNLLVYSGSFQAIWDEKAGLWSTDEYDVQRLVDADLFRFDKEYREKTGALTHVKALANWDSKGWSSFKRFLQALPENRQDMDSKLAFQNTDVKKDDYVTRRLSYSLEEGSYDAWDEVVGTLYSDDERRKIEWAVGAIVAGDSSTIQKFLVFYGKPGTGKSTVLNIIAKLFKGYTTIFDGKALTGNNNTFSTAPFKGNPLVAIQHDGDLSRIEDNTLLNTLTAHEEILVNEKYMKPIPVIPRAMLFMGTNEPVKIKNAKAGIIRRLIDVTPSGTLIPNHRYHSLMDQVHFELGGIAWHCLQVYEELGKNYYIDYVPTRMQYQTDFFYNFVESYHDVFKSQNGVSLNQAWEMYKKYCDESDVKRYPMYKFRSELENYFESVEDRVMIEGERLRNYYSGYKDIMAQATKIIEVEPYHIELHDFDGGDNSFNEACAEMPAQYAKASGFPGKKWEDNNWILSQLDPTKLHFVQIPENHIVIDFDLVDEDGEKDLDQNLKEAAKWPPTYTEISKSGRGVHLHYIYTGNVHELAQIYDVGIEVKTLLGDSSLRRQLTRCNNLPIAKISSGLPKKERQMIDEKSVQSERALRDLIERNLRKEIHPGTKPSMDFIHHILQETYDSGMSYNLLDMRPKILAFAAKSTHQAGACIKMIASMQFVGKNDMPEREEENGPLVFFDVEVYPNLLVICWKAQNSNIIVKMVNPTPQEVEPLFKLKLVGFNNRRYDNHILYARYLGNPIEKIYQISKSIIDGKQASMFGEAYNLSYADIYDFSSKKQSLKKFEIELGILHMELDLPWDEPIPKEHWHRVTEYCANDVVATEAVFNDREQDFVARQILAEISGLSINHTTQNHTAQIIFGEDKNPQSKFVYTNLNELFPGYIFNGKDSDYHGELVGEGGYVYSEPGLYSNVALLDVASMHPTSIELLNLFGPYTKNFSALKEARLAIKRKDYETARTLLDGKLNKFLDSAESNPESAEALSYALKIVINIVYGLTSAKFDNPFRDIRNKDNIVAKRGALFMIDLRQAVQDLGYQVVHIKTDSIKVVINPDAPKGGHEIIDFIMNFGKQYGYDFEYEGTYNKFCLVNDAVYIARTDIPSNNSYSDNSFKWTAVGAQFQHPFVFKTLFSNEELIFDDYCEPKSVVQGTMYLDFNDKGIDDFDNFVHIGRTGSFIPVLDDGGTLWRMKDGKAYAVSGTKGYKWITRDVANDRRTNDALNIDMSYFEHLKEQALESINKFGLYETLLES